MHDFHICSLQRTTGCVTTAFMFTYNSHLHLLPSSTYLHIYQYECIPPSFVVKSKSLDDTPIKALSYTMIKALVIYNRYSGGQKFGNTHISVDKFLNA